MAKQKYALNQGEKIVYKVSNIRQNCLLKNKWICYSRLRIY